MLRFVLMLILSASVARAYDFVRYGSAAEGALAAAAASYRVSPQQPREASGPVPCDEPEQLLYRHLALGFALPEDWFVNETGTVIVFLSEPGCGSLMRQFTVYTLRQDGCLHLAGVYRAISRAYTWQVARTRFLDGDRGMALVFTHADGSCRECIFDFSLPAAVYRIAPLHAPITPAEERGVCTRPSRSRGAPCIAVYSQ